MRRLLLCTDTWPPATSGGVLRPLKFATHLRGFGYATTVLTRAINARTQLDPSLVLQASTIPCHRIPVRKAWPDRLPGTARRWAERFISPPPLPDGMMRHMDPFILRARKLHTMEPFDAVLTTSPPHSFAVLGQALKTDLGIPWVADFRDEWSRNRLRTGRMTSEARARDREMERGTFRAADRILTTTATMRAFVVDSGVDPTRVVTLPNGFDEDDLPPPTPHVYGDRLVITYLGSLSSYRNLDPVLQAARRLRERSASFPFVFRLITQASRAMRFLRGHEDLVREGIVQIDDHLSYREGLAEAKQADVLLHVLSGATPENEPVAGKLFEYVALARPILFVSSVRGENERILDETGTGVTVLIDDVPAIENALGDLCRRWTERALEVSPRGIERFSRRRIAEQLAALLDAMLQVPASASVHPS